MIEFVLNSPEAIKRCLDVISKIQAKVPIMVVTIKRFAPKRTGQQNKYMWSHILECFSTQGIMNGRRYQQDSWHDHLKMLFMPESYDEELTLPEYKKWEERIDGSLKLVASTTKLTKKGAEMYFNKCYAFGTELGIFFDVKTKYEDY